MSSVCLSDRQATGLFLDTPDSRASICPNGEDNMTIGTILVIVLVLALLGALPAWPYSRDWGYGPSGITGLIVVVLVVLLVMKVV